MYNSKKKIIIGRLHGVFWEASLPVNERVEGKSKLHIVQWSYIEIKRGTTSVADKVIYEDILS